MRYTRPLSVCSETRLSPSFLRTTPARKPRTECCCHSVTVMIAAIVAPAGVRSIAMMRACLVSDRAADLDTGGADLLDAGLAVFRVERVAAFDLDLGLVIESCEFAGRHPPHHLSPAWAKDPAGLPPEARLGRSKSPQQRSDPTQRPVNSEQDSCSYSSIGLGPSQYLTDPARLASCRCSGGVLGGVEP